MSSVTKEMVDSFGALTEVRQDELLESGGVVAVTLRFERGAVLIRATDDDEIDLAAVEIAHGVDVSGRSPWLGARGRGLNWVWSLTNHQGYDDGYQFEFGETGRTDDQPEHLSIQLMSAASTLHVSTVSNWQ